MAKIDVLDFEGKKVEKIDIPKDIAEQEVNANLLHLEVRRFLASLRSGTHSTKTRSEVRGGGRKPWRQKGTGNARAGTIRSPLWKGGGIVFGPKPRSYEFKLNKKVIKKSKAMALADKYNEKRFLVLNEMIFDDVKTKKAAQILKGLNISDHKVLLVLEDFEGNEALSFRNLPNVYLTTTRSLSTYEILASEYVLFTKGSLEKFLKEFSNGRS
jgi:large subunit ribosomal protein L4